MEYEEQTFEVTGMELAGVDNPWEQVRKRKQTNFVSIQKTVEE